MDHTQFSIVSVAPTKPNSLNPAVVSQILSQKKPSPILNIDEIGRAGRSIQSSSRPISLSLEQYSRNSQTLLERLNGGFDIRPPLIQFSGEPNQLAFLTRKLTFKFFKSDNKLIRTMLESAGFTQTDKSDWNVLWIGTIPPSWVFQRLGPYQKVNHFPSSYEITQKDRLSLHISKMRKLFGNEHFAFFPESFVLPEDIAEFFETFQKEKKRLWIVKPVGSSQGKGIFLVDTMGEIPIDEQCIISRYVSNPLLINGLKFDLRLYVCITSFEPLRIYLYEEGLARFASEPYVASNKQNRHMHLTNYSLNKNSTQFVQNEDFRVDDSGHKWSMSALFKLLESSGLDTKALWSKIYDLIIKTLISCEASVTSAIKRLGLGPSNCFELLGFDVLIDDNFEPWLLEVNLSPSLATDSSLDSFIKSNLVRDMLNLAGLRAFSSDVDRTRVRCTTKHYSPTKRMSPIPQVYPRSKSPGLEMLRDLKYRFRDHLRDTLEEQFRHKHFVRIYPSKGSSYYDQFFESSKEINSHLYHVLYVELNNGISNRLLSPRFSSPGEERLPPLDESPRKHRCKTCKMPIKDRTLVCFRCRGRKKSNKESKLVLTGDDIIEEYIRRLINAIKNVGENALKSHWKRALLVFINHYVWGSEIRSEFGVLEKLTIRLSEMKQRRRKLPMNKRNPAKVESEKQKTQLIKQVTVQQLEDMMVSHTKNAAYDLISCFMDEHGKGLLSHIMREEEE